MSKQSESDFQATQDREDPVLNAFMATEEFEEWQDFGDDADKIWEDENLDKVEVPTAWLRRVLPEIRSSPLIFSAMVEVWNRECDRLGMPERKMKSTPQRAEEDGNDGPF
jgi:hypothetical protein